MVFTIKTKDGNDIMSQEYETHQEALWNLCHSLDYGSEKESREEREEVFFIDDSESWINQKIECPQCEKQATWADADMDVIECFACGEYTPYPFKKKNSL